MDRIRLSKGLLKNAEWHATYKSIIGIDEVESCKEGCISDLGCVAWKINDDRECFFASSLVDDPPDIKKSSGTISGIITYETSYSILEMILYFILGGSILFLAWYLLHINKCSGKKRKSKS